ncbi:MAG TPA: hypothetical protein VE572_01030 [Nitrososphaeraceae archaeon]|jgi:hypothetical protein|nr:hypothetical protein [Nitrososphaeraceae archaeon]
MEKKTANEKEPSHIFACFFSSFSAAYDGEDAAKKIWHKVA